MFGSLRALVVLAVGTGLLVLPTARADDKGDKTKKPGQPAAEPVKPIIIQIDGSKLPPDVLKELLKLSKSSEPTKPVVKPGTDGEKPGTKPDVKPPMKPVVKPGTDGEKPGTIKPGVKPTKAISLTDAIAVVEKSTQGTVVKAAREEDDGKVQFKLEVIDGKGGKSKVTLDASGKMTGTEKKGEEKQQNKKKSG